MNTLWFTLSRAAKDLIAFLVGYVLFAGERGAVGLHACTWFLWPAPSAPYLFESASLHVVLFAIF